MTFIFSRRAKIAVILSVIRNMRTANKNFCVCLPATKNHPQLELARVEKLINRFMLKIPELGYLGQFIRVKLDHFSCATFCPVASFRAYTQGPRFGLATT